MEEIKMDKTKEREYEVMTSFWTVFFFNFEEISIADANQTWQEMFKEIDAENDEIVYQRDLIVYLKCLNEGPLDNRKVRFWFDVSITDGK